MLSSGTISTSAPGYHKNTEQPNFLYTRHKRHSEGGGLGPSTRGVLLREDVELFHLWTLRKQDSAGLHQESSAQFPITWMLAGERAGPSQEPLSSGVPAAEEVGEGLER